MPSISTLFYISNCYYKNFFKYSVFVKCVYQNYNILNRPHCIKDKPSAKEIKVKQSKTYLVKEAKYNTFILPPKTMPFKRNIPSLRLNPKMKGI